MMVNKIKLMSTFIIKVDCQSQPIMVPPQRHANNKLHKVIPAKKDGLEYALTLEYLRLLYRR